MDILISVSEALVSYICLLLIIFQWISYYNLKKKHNIITAKTRYYNMPDTITLIMLINNPVWCCEIIHILSNNLIILSFICPVVKI